VNPRCSGVAVLFSPVIIKDLLVSRTFLLATTDFTLEAITTGTVGPLPVCKNTDHDARSSRSYFCCRHVCALRLRAFSAFFFYCTVIVSVIVHPRINTLAAPLQPVTSPGCSLFGNLSRFQLPESTRSLIFISCDWTQARTLSGR
jgi:hypothetical protein